jgi:hypothetical protein
MSNGVGNQGPPAGGTGGGGGQGAVQQQAGAQPVGGGNYIVKQGECIESIALAHGFLPDTLWNHPDNAQLKQERKDPSMLLPGDRVQVPDPRPKQEQGADSQRHRFRRKGYPSKLRVRVLRNGEPRKNEPYTLNVDGKLSQGNTDGDGVVEVPVPPNAQQGALIVGKDEKDQQKFDLRLSGLDPVASTTGVQQRLENLGYPCPISGELDEPTRSAIGDFQRACDIEATGEPDQKTRDRLAKEHGS